MYGKYFNFNLNLLQYTVYKTNFSMWDGEEISLRKTNLNKFINSLLNRRSVNSYLLTWYL